VASVLECKAQAVICRLPIPLTRVQSHVSSCGRCGEQSATVFWLPCFLVSWGGVRLSPLGTSATNWPNVPTPDNRWWWIWSSPWNENRQGKAKYSEKTCPNSTLFTTNQTWADLGSNPGRRGGKPPTYRLSYGTALIVLLILIPHNIPLSSICHLDLVKVAIYGQTTNGLSLTSAWQSVHLGRHAEVWIWR
jgi:hypothetical protein